MLKKYKKLPVILFFIVLMVFIFLILRAHNELFKNQLNMIKSEVRYFFQAGTALIENPPQGTLPSSRTIDTSQLPLEMNYFADLKKAGVIGDGSSIYVLEDKILLMDRLGKFYLIDLTGKVRKLNLQTPSNHELYLKESPEKRLHSGVLKATSFVLDSVNKKIYVAFNKYWGNEKLSLTVGVVNFEIENETNSSKYKWEILFESEVIIGQQEATHGSGGKILLVNDDLFLTIGFPISDDKRGKEKTLEIGLENTPAQNLNNQLGKVIKINKNTGNYKIFTSGHRNPQGLTITSNGDLISTEHGPQGGDEVNILREGGNYGWPLATFGTRYGTYDYDWPDFINRNKKNKFTQPLFAFVPSIGISSIIEIKTFNRKYANDLLVGSLKAQSLYRLKLDDYKKVIFSEQIWVGHRIRDIFEKNQKIFLLTDDPYLVEIRVDTEKLSKNITKNDLYFTSDAIKKCITCHAFSQTTPTSLAPSLQGVLGRKIATDNYQGYSDSFKKSSLIWTKEALRNYLTLPQKVVPGTVMPNVYLSSKEIDEIIEILERY